MEFVNLLIVLALIATIVALGTGIGSMIRGGEFDRRHSTEFMFLRVGAQGAAVVLLLVALVVAAL